MKEKLVEYREGSFVDFNGADHYFVVCAILIECHNGSVRKLSFGVSFCNPVDKNNNTLGKKIAYGKAIACRDHNCVIGRAGLLNLQNVKAIIDNEVAHVQQYPESYSISYAKARNKYKVNESN